MYSDHSSRAIALRTYALQAVQTYQQGFFCTSVYALAYMNMCTLGVATHLAVPPVELTVANVVF